MQDKISIHTYKTNTSHLNYSNHIFQKASITHLKKNMQTSSLKTHRILTYQSDQIKAHPIIIY